MNAIISLNNLEIDCLIGCLNFEREQTQKILVNLEVIVDAKGPAREDKLSLAWNYAEWGEQIAFILRTNRFKLLEYAAATILRYLVLPPVHDGQKRPSVKKAKISLTKSAYLTQESKATVTMEATPLTFGKSKQKNELWGYHHVIREDKNGSLSRVIIKSGKTARLVTRGTTHYHLLTSGLIEKNPGEYFNPLSHPAVYLMVSTQ